MTFNQGKVRKFLDCESSYTTKGKGKDVIL